MPGWSRSNRTSRCGMFALNPRSELEYDLGEALGAGQERALSLEVKLFVDTSRPSVPLSSESEPLSEERLAAFDVRRAEKLEF